MNRIYTPEEHHYAVGSALANAGMAFSPRALVGVRAGRYHELAGVEGGMFAYIGNHPIPVDRDLMDFIRAHGFIVMTLDDGAARARFERARPSAYDSMMSRRGAQR